MYNQKIIFSLLIQVMWNYTFFVYKIIIIAWLKTRLNNFIFTFFLFIQITHVWHNQTLRRKEDHQDHDQLRSCFYKGQVAGDDTSVVSVSLCGGMVSVFIYIFTLHLPRKNNAKITEEKHTFLIKIFEIHITCRFLNKKKKQIYYIFFVYNVHLFINIYFNQMLFYISIYVLVQTLKNIFFMCTKLTSYF